MLVHTGPLVWRFVSWGATGFGFWVLNRLPGLYGLQYLSLVDVSKTRILGLLAAKTVVYQACALEVQT